MGVANIAPVVVTAMASRSLQLYQVSSVLYLISGLR